MDQNRFIKTFQQHIKGLLYIGTMMVMVLFGMTAFSQQSNFQNWDQFRGELRNGASDENIISDGWTDSEPELLWTKYVGEAFSEVAVFNGTSFIFSSDTLDGGYEYLAAIEAESGKDLWKSRVDSLYLEIDGWGNGPRATPAVDNDLVFCLSGLGKLSALSVRNGEIIWTVDLIKDFGATLPRWGFSSSPLLINNILMLETGGTEDRAFTAFNKNTGEVIWSKGTGVAGYNSPIIAKIDNMMNVVFTSGTTLYSYNMEGDTNWTFEMPLRSPTAMPVFLPPDKFFVSSVSETGGFTIQVENNEPSLVYTSPIMQNNWSSSCYLDGYLYGFSKAKLQCVSAETGELQWGQRGFGKGSLILVGDKLLVLSDRGILTMAEATPEKYKKLGSFQALVGKSWTAPSFSDGKIFVRNLSHMSCYKLTNAL